MEISCVMVEAQADTERLRRVGGSSGAQWPAKGAKPLRAAEALLPSAALTLYGGMVRHHGQHDGLVR